MRDLLYNRIKRLTKIFVFNNLMFRKTLIMNYQKDITDMKKTIHFNLNITCYFCPAVAVVLAVFLVPLASIHASM